jgi:hypothetical protein
MTIKDQSVERFENEAEAARRRLSQTLDELSVKLTPGGVLDEMLTYAKAGGQDFMKALGRSAAANPLPALFIGVGCAMFITGRGRITGTTEREGAYRSDRAEPFGDHAVPGHRAGEGRSGIDRAASAAGSAISSAAGSVRDGAEAVADIVAEQARSGAGMVGASASNLAEKVGEGASAVGEAVAGTAAKVAETARRAAGSAAEYADGMRDKTAVQGRRAAVRVDAMRRTISDGTATLVREQPLLVAAGGLVLGAAIAALFPRTEFEDTVMGEASDAVKKTVGKVASGTLDTAEAAVGHVANEVAAAAQAEGLTLDDATESLKNLGDKMAKVASAGAEAAKEETERAFRPAG